MSNPVILTELWRGPFLECTHSGHAVICDETGQIVDAWGDPNALFMPRSSAKMIQALPLVESGAADAFGLSREQLALCLRVASGASMHTDRVRNWLTALDLGDADLRCGPQMPQDRAAFNALIRSDSKPCQIHNNCSGKHAGFLTLSKHLRGGPEYVDFDHPVQLASLAAFEDVTGETSPGAGIDGCSAPNPACTMHGAWPGPWPNSPPPATGPTRGRRPWSGSGRQWSPIPTWWPAIATAATAADACHQSTRGHQERRRRLLLGNHPRPQAGHRPEGHGWRNPRLELHHRRAPDPARAYSMPIIPPPAAS